MRTFHLCRVLGITVDEKKKEGAQLEKWKTITITITTIELTARIALNVNLKWKPEITKILLMFHIVCMCNILMPSLWSRWSFWIILNVWCRKACNMHVAFFFPWGYDCCITEINAIILNISFVEQVAAMV